MLLAGPASASCAGDGSALAGPALAGPALAGPAFPPPPNAVAFNTASGAPETSGQGVSPLGARGARPLPPRAMPVATAPIFGALEADASFAWSGSIDGIVGRFGCLADGSTSGSWLVRFAGYGCASFGFAGDVTVVAMQPAAAAAAWDTHAALVLGPAASSHAAPLGVNAQLFTAHQLRTGTAPNPWEVGWLVWHYADDDHFYYFIPKPNGWELGKRDPAYPGGQRFLATGSAPRFPIGEWHDVTITQSGATIVVRVNGRELVTFTDREAAYTGGRIGVYTEDAGVVARGPRIAS